MVIYKAYKFRMYPTIDQQHKLNSFMGTSRFIYNYYLDKIIKQYEENKKNYFLKEMKKDIVELYSEYNWLKEVDSLLLRTTLDDLDRAFTNFFEMRNGYPKFKAKNNKDSYRTICIRSSYKGVNYSNIKVDLENKTIKLPKIDNIKIRGYRHLDNFNKKILSATISKEASKYFVSVLVEEYLIDKPYKLNSVIGLDLGVKNLVITSEGFKYNAMRNIDRLNKKLKGLNKWLSRCVKGSNNRQKVINKIRRVNLKIRNIRKYLIHNITSKIVKENDLICIENLKVKEMIINTNKNLKKLLTNASLSEVIRQLKYKSSWYNKRIIELNEYYPSSQICSHCGERNKELSNLSIRKFECSKCHNESDRDINASINIMYEGLIKYMKKQMA